MGMQFNTMQTTNIRATEVKGVRIYVPKYIEERMMCLVESIKDSSRFGEYASFGTLHYGIQGTGKTILAKKVAEMTGAGYYEVPALSSPDELTAYFKSARKLAEGGDKRALIVFDDVEYLGKRSDPSNQHYSAILKAMLQETQDTKQNRNVFWIATTNLPEKLDEAFRRPPRITMEIEFLPPNRGEREYMLEAILGDKAIGMGWNKELIKYAAGITYGYTGGDLLGLVELAVMASTMDKGSKSITEKNVNWAKANMKPSAIRDLPYIEPYEKLEDVAGKYILPQKDMLATFATRIDNGMLTILYGPSGSGKTYLARALAGSFGFNTLYVDASKVVDKYVGESGKILDRMFTRAKALTPCFLIIDQAEGIINQGNQYSDEWLSVLKASTSQPMPGVFVILIASDPSNWGPEILSRFRKVYIPEADRASMTAVFKALLAKHFSVKSGKGDSKLVCDVDVDEALALGLATGGRAINPRSLERILTTIKDLGGVLTTDMLIDAIQSQPEEADSNVNFEDVRKIVGDDTVIYQAIMGSGKK